MKFVFLCLFAIMTLLSLVAWLWQPGDDDDRTALVWAVDDNPMRRRQIELFNELHPEYNLMLDPQPPSTAGLEKVIVQCLAGVGPDVFDCYNASQLSAYVRAGIARDVTEELSARGVTPNSVWPALRPLIVLDDRMYGFPGNANAHAVWFNKTLFDRAGMPYPRAPWSWEDFIETAKKLTIRNARGQPVQFGFIGYWDYKAALYQWGARIFTPAGTRSALDSPEATAAMQFMEDLIFVHGITPSLDEEKSLATAGGWGTGPITLFGDERGAMAIGGRWWLCILRHDDYAHLELGAVDMPCGPSCTIPGGGRSTLVNARSENQEGALLFLEYLHSAEWNNLINQQADALAPVIEYNYTEDFLYNPDHPEEDYNDVWRTALENAVPEDISPYINGQKVERILLKQTDLVRAGGKSGPAAMKTAAREINLGIIDTLRRDPVLREHYKAALAAGAPPAWDNAEEAPW